jgi:hypothetical protein
MKLKLPFLAFFESIITLFASIDDKVKDAPKSGNPGSKGGEYKANPSVVKARENAPEGAKKGYGAMNNLNNIFNNAIDNTILRPVASYQNWRAKANIRKDPNKQVVFLAPGVAQNIGAQWRYARELNKRGHVAYHVKQYHGKGIEPNLDKTYEQIFKFYNKAKVADPTRRNDYFSGHSSGGNAAIHMSFDDRTKKTGIQGFQARAPTPYGIEKKNLYHKVIGMMLPGTMRYEDVVNDAKAKEYAQKVLQNTPYRPVHIVAGENDKLVPPKYTTYLKAQTHYMVKGKDSTHFGTSGSNADTNIEQADHLENTVMRYKNKR